MNPLFIKTQKIRRGWLCLALFIGTFPVVAQNLVLTSTYPVGNGPNNVVAADVNNDGKLDLICANDSTNFNGNTVTVLTNNGAGVFGSNATYTVGKAPFVTAADLHGTGKPDLITANFADSTLMVLTNNGAGVFGSNATYAVGNGPFNVIAVDVNNDGKLDLICANDGTNYDGNTLTMLTNNGNGTFTFSATSKVGKLPSVTAADLRGIGRPDLITANFGDNTLTVLTNNGAGLFGSNATYAVGINPINVVAANVNNDTKLDLICANNGTNTLTVLTNNGNGTFTLSATLVVDSAPFVTAADANGDGNADLITANYSTASLRVLTNNGTGIFGSNANYTVGDSPISVTAADVNNDGRQELISVNFGDNSLTVRLEIPKLNLQITNQNAIISWPPFWSGYVLQQNASLGTASWNLVSNQTGTNSLVLSAATGNKVFRLRHP